MRRIVAAFIFVAFPLASALSVASPGLAQQRDQPTSTVDLASLDRSADPCGDFYQFACGGWMTSHPIPSDRSSWATFDELQERNNHKLREILEPADTHPTEDSRKIGDYYASCMDESGINARGLMPLQPALNRIASLKNRAGLPSLLATLHPIGTTAFFFPSSAPDIDDAAVQLASIYPAGLGLPDRDYYFRDDERSVELRRQYVDHIGKMFQLLGASADQASSRAAAVMRVETEIARPQLDVVARRDPAKVNHKMRLAELQGLTPQFKWQEYLKGIGAPEFTKANVTQPEYLQALDRLLSTLPLDDVKDYLRWQLIHANAPVLPTTFVNENFRFYGKTLQGTPELRPRWKLCVDYTDGDLGEALGKAYVAKNFGPQAKADTLAMVAAIEAALQQDISTLTWMSEDTRKEALKKLHAVSHKIGYPDKWRDYSKLRIVRGDALGNSQRANTFDFRRTIDRIGKRVDPRRMGDDAAHCECVLQPHAKQHQLPCRHPAAAVLLRRRRSRHQLRRRGRRGGPRVDPRLRRPGPQVRRERQPPRLVEGRRRKELRESSAVFRGRVRRVQDRRREGEWKVDARGEHRRQRRLAARPRRVFGDGGHAARPERRRLHARAALLPWIRPGVVRKCPARGGPSSCANESAFARALSHERRRLEHAGVRESILLQAGRADDASKCVPCLVTGGCT
jgi:Peptidase family M13